MEELIEFSIVAYEMGLSDEKAMKFFKEFGKGLVMYEGNLMSVAHAEQLKSLHKDWIAVAHMFIEETENRLAPVAAVSAWIRIPMQ